MSRITDMRVDFQAKSSEWLFKSPLAGGGAYRGGLTTGRTACLFTLQYSIPVVTQVVEWS